MALPTCQQEKMGILSRVALFFFSSTDFIYHLPFSFISISNALETSDIRESYLRDPTRQQDGPFRARRGHNKPPTIGFGTPRWHWNI